MVLLRIGIAGSKTERKQPWLYSFLHTETVNYETVLTPKLVDSVTGPEDKFVSIIPVKVIIHFFSFFFFLSSGVYTAQLCNHKTQFKIFFYCTQKCNGFNFITV